VRSKFGDPHDGVVIAGVGGADLTGRSPASNDTNAHYGALR
jgi:hypothetical protein